MFALLNNIVSFVVVEMFRIASLSLVCAELDVATVVHRVVLPFKLFCFEIGKKTPEESQELLS